MEDVLKQVYEHFMQRISQVDWVQLGPDEEREIGRAYTARCKALGSLAAVESSHGVKRIDYARGKVWFKGFVRAGEGLEVLKLRLSRKP